MINKMTIAEFNDLILRMERTVIQAESEAAKACGENQTRMNGYYMGFAKGIQFVVDSLNNIKEDYDFE
jgi:hypothetical protein